MTTIGVQKGLAQLAVSTREGDQVGVEQLREILSHPDNVYLGRYLAWVFVTGGIDRFTVMPRDDADVERLAAVLSADEPGEVVHVVVGKTISAPMESPSTVAGLPAVRAERVLKFSPSEFAEAVAEKEEGNREDPSATGSDSDRPRFEALVSTVFLRLTRGAALAGLADEDRALGYVACEYPTVYHVVKDAQGDGKVLVGIDARHEHSPDRRMVSVRLTFRRQRNDLIERYHCLVDVTEPVFHFLITPLRPAYD